jgi:hypothetical protein
MLSGKSLPELLSSFSQSLPNTRQKMLKNLYINTQLSKNPALFLCLAQHSKMEEWTVQIRGVCVEILEVHYTKHNTVKQKIIFDIAHFQVTGHFKGQIFWCWLQESHSSKMTV